MHAASCNPLNLRAFQEERPALKKEASEPLAGKVSNERRDGAAESVLQTQNAYRVVALLEGLGDPSGRRTELR